MPPKFYLDAFTFEGAPLRGDAAKILGRLCYFGGRNCHFFLLTTLNEQIECQFLSDWTDEDSDFDLKSFEKQNSVLLDKVHWSNVVGIKNHNRLKKIGFVFPDGWDGYANGPKFIVFQRQPDGSDGSKFVLYKLKKSQDLDVKHDSYRAIKKLCDLVGDVEIIRLSDIEFN